MTDVAEGLVLFARFMEARRPPTQPGSSGATLLNVGGGRNSGSEAPRGRSGAGNRGGFIGSPEEYDGYVRGRFGDEVADRVQRSLERTRHPRSLTDREQQQLQAALAPMLRDMRATGAVLPDIVPEAHEDRGEAFVCAWIDDGDLGGCGISVWITESPADQVSQLAEQLVEWANDVQSGRTATWPPCPDHPDGHALWPDCEDGRAVWKCSTSDRVVCAIGALPGSEPEWQVAT
jgi:hypothetical protein